MSNYGIYNDDPPVDDGHVPELCARCGMPYHACEGHGSSPTSPDNDAEEGK